VFKPAGERVVSGPVRTRSAGRRHETGPELQDDLLPILSVAADPRHIERIERDRRRTGRFLPLVVTADAILVQKRALGRYCRGRGLRLQRTRRLNWSRTGSEQHHPGKYERTHAEPPRTDSGDAGLSQRDPTHLFRLLRASEAQRESSRRP